MPRLQRVHPFDTFHVDDTLRAVDLRPEISGSLRPVAVVALGFPEMAREESVDRLEIH